jgi:hypothetical protein
MVLTIAGSLDWRRCTSDDAVNFTDMGRNDGNAAIRVKSHPICCIGSPLRRSTICTYNTGIVTSSVVR